VFDPFKDFATAGYLRNSAGEKDLRIVKRVEHELFRANLPDAVAFLAKLPSVAYADFLESTGSCFGASIRGPDRIALSWLRNVPSPRGRPCSRTRPLLAWLSKKDFAWGTTTRG
jgi:hypothetical protein